MATKTFDELIAGATAIKNNELPESNTHNLVGGQLIEMATKHKESDQQSDVINVTTKFPLAAGSYYTSSTARAAVTAEYRKLGKKLLYQTDATTWIEEKFIGSAITDAIWNADANWQGVASKNDVIQLGADFNTFNVNYNRQGSFSDAKITSETSDVFNLINLTWEAGFIHKNGSIVGTGEALIHTKEYIGINSSTKFTSGGYLKRSDCAHIAAYDKDFNFLPLDSYIPSETSFSFNNWDPSTDVAFIRISVYNTQYYNIEYSGSIDVYGVKAFEYISKLTNTTNNELANKADKANVYQSSYTLDIRSAYNWSQGTIAISNGVIDANNAGYKYSDFIPAISGTTFEGLMKSSYYVASVAFYSIANDSGYLVGKCIRADEITSRVDLSTVGMPSEAKYIRFCVQSSFITSSTDVFKGNILLYPSDVTPLLSKSIEENTSNITTKASAADVEDLKRINISTKNFINGLRRKGEAMLLSTHPLNFINMFKRFNYRYNFGGITLVEDFVIPTDYTTVTIKVSANPNDSHNTPFITTANPYNRIAIGTKDKYNVFAVIAVNNTDITISLLTDNLGFIGKKIPANVAFPLYNVSSVALTTPTKIFRYSDILSYEAGELPYTISDDGVHPFSPTGYNIYAEIIADTIKQKFTPARVISFGDSWTQISNGWKHIEDVIAGCTTINQGMSSDRIGQVMIRFRTYMQTYTPQAGDAFVFVLGTNDLFDIFRYFNPGATSGTSDEYLMMHNYNYVNLLMEACEEISQALPNGNWFVNGGHALSSAYDTVTA